MTSAATWMDPRKDLQRIMWLAIDATSALDTARMLGVNHWALTCIAENLEKLKSGQLNRNGQRVLRSHVNGVKQVLKEIQTNDNGCGRAILVGARNARPSQV